MYDRKGERCGINLVYIDIYVCIRERKKENGVRGRDRELEKQREIKSGRKSSIKRQSKINEFRQPCSLLINCLDQNLLIFK